VPLRSRFVELVVAQVHHELLHVYADLLHEGGLPHLLRLLLDVLRVSSLPQLLKKPDHVTNLGLSSFCWSYLTQQLSRHKVGFIQLSLLRTPGCHRIAGMKLHSWFLCHAYREWVVK